MDLIRKLRTARKLILVIMIPLSLLPLPLIYPSSVSTLLCQAFLRVRYGAWRGPRELCIPIVFSSCTYGRLWCLSFPDTIRHVG